MISIQLVNLSEEISMQKKWDITIMKMGSIQIEAETEEDAIKKVENIVSLSEYITWEDGWNAVDISRV